MTPKATLLYNEARRTFEEYSDDCFLDALDNYYDFLNAADDTLLDMFAVSYNIELYDDDDVIRYEDPSIILNPKTPCYFGKVYISCRAYETECGISIRCDSTESNQKEADDFVGMLREILTSRQS